MSAAAAAAAAPPANTAAPATTTKSDTITLGSGGVIKKILKEGTGDATPPEGADVEVHYTGTLMDGSKFDSSRDRNDTFHFKIGKGQVIKGWDVGVASMRRGERAILTCRADYAYGSSGSPPKIPPNATLNFDVELIDWTKKQKVTDDKKVMKEIIKEGEGYNRPNDGAKVHVRYTGRVVGGAAPFIDHSVVSGGGGDTAPFSFTIGASSAVHMTEGLEESIKNMLAGEHSRFSVHPQYGYGETGCPEYKIGPNAHLEYDIELVSYEKGKETWEMSGDEKLALATHYKNLGNDYFKRGSYERALKKYNAGLAPFKYEAQFDAAPDVLSKVREIKVTLNSNIATVKHKTKDFKGVETACNDALTIDPKHVKSLFKRAQVLAAQNEFDRALIDLITARSVEPTNADVQKLYTAVNARVEASKQRERNMWAGAFGKVNLVTSAEETARKAKLAADQAKRKQEMNDMSDEEDIAPPVPVSAPTPSVNATPDAAVAAKVDADVSNPKPAASATGSGSAAAPAPAPASAAAPAPTKPKADSTKA